MDSRGSVYIVIEVVMCIIKKEKFRAIMQMNKFIRENSGPINRPLRGFAAMDGLPCLFCECP